jgi:hypothetical protein
VVSTLEHDPDAIAEWLDGLRRRFPERPIEIAIEQSRGALVHALRECDGVRLYPINPQQRARYREAVHPSGGQDDPRDAELLAKFLRQTCHEFADHARQGSTWSKAFYALKLSQGLKHHAAVRALAYKWIRILFLFRLWTTPTAYSESHDLAQRPKNNSPLLKFLEQA